MVTESARVSRNEWESDFFGREIYRLEMRESCAPADLAQCLAQAPSAAWIEAHVPIESLARLALLTKAGFFIADTVADFERVIDESTGAPALPTDVEIRTASASDLPNLHRVARSIKFPSRFYLSPFSELDGDRFYSRWIQNAIEGTFDEVCLVAAGRESCAGFISARRVEEDACRIGLLGIDEAWRGRGLALELWRQAERWCRTLGRKRLFVATQLQNLQAIRFYERIGGRMRAARVHVYRAPSGSW